MILAILFCEDEVVAAAPACDQAPHGDRYWSEIHAGDFEIGRMFETAYIEIQDHQLRERLLAASIKDEICGYELADEVMARPRLRYEPGQAA